jgi:hypothetical protein
MQQLRDLTRGHHLITSQAPRARRKRGNAVDMCGRGRHGRSRCTTGRDVSRTYQDVFEDV